MRQPSDCQNDLQQDIFQIYDQIPQDDQDVRVEEIDGPIMVASKQSPNNLANESKITFLSDMDDVYRQSSQLDTLRGLKEHQTSV
jgi:hypothetical protein